MENYGTNLSPNFQQESGPDPPPLVLVVKTNRIFNLSHLVKLNSKHKISMLYTFYYELCRHGICQKHTDIIHLKVHLAGVNESFKHILFVSNESLVTQFISFGLTILVQGSKIGENTRITLCILVNTTQCLVSKIMEINLLLIIWVQEFCTVFKYQF